VLESKLSCVQERDYQNGKSPIRKIIGDVVSASYKFIFRPTPYEKIRLSELINLGHPTSVLEVGAGDDDFYKFVLRGNPFVRYLRSDISERQLSKTRDSGVQSLVCDNVFYPFRNASFDVVLSKCVIHHVDDPNPVLRKEARISFLRAKMNLLSLGGRVFCADVYDPVRNNMKGKFWHALKHRLILDEEEHHFLSTEEIKRHFIDAGLRRVGVDEVNTYKGVYFVAYGVKGGSRD